MFHQQQVTGPDGALQVAQGPENGPPLLFLHGVGRAWRDFSGLMSALAPCWQVFALDFRGHGLSARTPEKYLVSDYVRDAVAVIQHIDKPLLLYGHSLGAMVAGIVAAEQSRQVRGAILEDPPYKLFAPGADDTPFHALFTLMRSVSGSERSVRELSRILAEARLPAAGSPEGVPLGDLRDATSIRFGAACLKRVDPTVWDPILEGRWLEDLNYRSLLPKIRCPILLLQGNVEQGGMVSAEAGDELTSLIPDCLRMPWDDIGHLIHGLLPERTLRVVREFLDSIALDERAFHT